MDTANSTVASQFLYHVAEAPDPAALAHLVEKLVSQGWQLQGGVAVVWSNVSWIERPTRYYQALTITYFPAGEQ